MKYTADRKLRTRGEIYSSVSGLTRTLNNRQTRFAGLMLLIAAIAASAVIARSLLLPDSSFIISGEEKPHTGLTVEAGESGSSDTVVADTYGPPISTGTVATGGYKPFAVQVPNPGQLQAPATGTINPPATGGMGGGLPETPDTDCGCVNRAVDKVTGTLTPLPGY